MNKAGDRYYATIIMDSVTDDFIAGEEFTCSSPSIQDTVISYNNCEKTVGSCRRMNNSERFGGYPSVGRGGLKI